MILGSSLCARCARLSLSSLSELSLSEFAAADSSFSVPSSLLSLLSAVCVRGELPSGRIFLVCLAPLVLNPGPSLNGEFKAEVQLYLPRFIVSFRGFSGVRFTDFYKVTGSSTVSSSKNLKIGCSPSVSISITSLFLVVGEFSMMSSGFSSIYPRRMWSMCTIFALFCGNSINRTSFSDFLGVFRGQVTQIEVLGCDLGRSVLSRTSHLTLVGRNVRIEDLKSC